MLYISGLSTLNAAVISSTDLVAQDGWDHKFPTLLRDLWSMCAAARTAPKTRGRDNIETLILMDDDVKKYSPHAWG